MDIYPLEKFLTSIQYSESDKITALLFYFQIYAPLYYYIYSNSKIDRDQACDQNLWRPFIGYFLPHSSSTTAPTAGAVPLVMACCSPLVHPERPGPAPLLTSIQYIVYIYSLLGDPRARTHMPTLIIAPRFAHCQGGRWLVPWYTFFQLYMRY